MTKKMHQVSKILFYHETLHVPGIFCAHHQELSAGQRPHNLHETYQLPRVQLITPDDGHRRCPKHAEFRDKIKVWILDASCWLFIQRLSRRTVTWTENTNGRLAFWQNKFLIKPAGGVWGRLDQACHRRRCPGSDMNRISLDYKLRGATAEDN
jgi:hypothetical protein